MTGQTSKHKHPISCLGSQPKQPKTKYIKVEPTEHVDIDLETPAIPPFKQSTRQNKQSTI